MQDASKVFVDLLSGAIQRFSDGRVVQAASDQGDYLLCDYLHSAPNCVWFPYDVGDTVFEVEGVLRVV